MSDTVLADNPIFAALRGAMPGLTDHDAPRFARAITLPEPYRPGPDTQPKEGVPEGRLSAHRHRRRGRLSRRGARLPGLRAGAVRRDESPRRTCSCSRTAARYLGAPRTNARVVLDNLIATRARSR